MQRTFIVFIILIGFALGITACSTGRTARYPRYPNYPYPPGGQGYPGYPGGYPPGYGQNMEQLRTLAEYLRDATAEVSEEALEAPADGPAYEESLITQLQELEKEAKAFDEKVRTGNVNPTYGDPRYGDPTYGDPRYGGYQAPQSEGFSEVLQEYYAARKAVQNLPKEDDVFQDFERVTNVMRSLTKLHGYRFEPDYENLEPVVQ